MTQIDPTTIAAYAVAQAREGKLSNDWGDEVGDALDEWTLAYADRYSNDRAYDRFQEASAVLYAMLEAQADAGVA